MFTRRSRTSPGQVPDAVPVLSAGKHRSPRSGACFMEMASFLAGERWSDHPRCTDPVLAGLARAVNDTVGDSARQLLAPLVADVVGLQAPDAAGRARVAATVVRRAALAALPVAPAERQNVLVVALQSAVERLAALDGADRRGTRDVEAAEALAVVPSALRWATEFRARAGVGPIDPCAIDSDADVRAVALAVDGIGQACCDGREERLVGLLRAAIADARRAATGDTGEDADTGRSATPGDLPARRLATARNMRAVASR